MKHLLLIIVFCLIQNNIFCQNPEWIVYHNYDSNLPGEFIHYIKIDKHGRKWISTEFGLAVYDDINWTIYNTSNSNIPDNDVWGIDFEGESVWITTFNGGVAKFDGINWIVYNTTNSGLPNNRSFASILVDKQGIKWFGTFSGIAKFNDTTWTVYNTTNSQLPDDITYHITEDRFQNKWFSCNQQGGLAKFDGTTWTIYNKNNSGIPLLGTSNDDATYETAMDTSDNIWVGTAYGGFAKFDGQNWTVYDTIGPNHARSCIAIDSMDTKWVGTGYNGVIKFDNTNFTFYNTSNSGIPDDNIYSIAIDSIGNKWIGTDGGLAVFKEGGVITNQENNKYQIKRKVTIYPNPATNVIHILGLTNKATIKVFDMLGKLQLQKEVESDATINISQLTQGVYTLAIEAKGGRTVNRMVINK